MWVIKDQLIEKILISSQGSPQITTPPDIRTITSLSDQPNLLVADECASDQENLDEKKREITRLNNELTKTNSVLTNVLERLTTLETNTLASHVANLEKTVDQG